jgi:hypothetical protein
MFGASNKIKAFGQASYHVETFEIQRSRLHPLLSALGGGKQKLEKLHTKD